MKRTFIATLALLASTALAQAEDPIVDTDYDWSGFYIGANIGYGISLGNVDVSSVGPDDFPQGVIDNIGDGSFETDSDGFLGGAQIGYGWRMDQIVLGIEADAQYADFGGHSLDVGGGDGIRTSQELEFLATLRARLGYAVSEGALIYLTGGLAVGGVDLEGHLSNSGFRGGDDWVDSASSTEWGWVAGFGGEFMLDNNIGLKAEYLFVDLGDESFATRGDVSADEITEFDFDNQFQVARIGLNWYFR